MSNFYLHKYGRFGDVDVAGEDIWDLGSNYLFPTVATSTQIVGLANDIPSSDGVHSVTVEGLLADGSDITEVATLNGTTPVVLTNSFYRVNRAYIGAVGATGINSGNIDVTHSGSATLARISPLQGQTLQTCYTLPTDVVGSVLSWTATCGRPTSRGDVAGTIALQTRENGLGWRTRDTFEMVDGAHYYRAFGNPEAIPVSGLSDIRVRITTINTDNVAVSAGFELTGFRNIR